MGSKAKLQFDVEMSCESCANSIRTALSKIGISEPQIDVKGQQVIIDTTLPISLILDTIESTGKRAVLKGYGFEGSSQLENAVAELKSTASVIGVIRFFQLNKHLCIVDGTIDGLAPGDHGLHIYEYGDLSRNSEGIGCHFNPQNMPHGGPADEQKHYGDLGNVTANSEGRSVFRFENKTVKTWEIIGRSLAVCSQKDDYGKGANDLSKIDGNCGEKLAYAIIARSSSLFGNLKRICACDGVSVWDERDAPLAGESRSKYGKL